MSGRTASLVAVPIALILALSGCTPGESIAYHATPTFIDVAFCDDLSASSLTIEFSNYDPGRTVIAVQEYAGAEADFGDGRPVSDSTVEWVMSESSDPMPEDWDRVDFTFYADDGGQRGRGQFLFRRDVISDDWAWTEGFNIGRPECELRLG